MLHQGITEHQPFREGGGREISGRAHGEPLLISFKNFQVQYREGEKWEGKGGVGEMREVPSRCAYILFTWPCTKLYYRNISKDQGGLPGTLPIITHTK